MNYRVTIIIQFWALKVAFQIVKPLFQTLKSSGLSAYALPVSSPGRTSTFQQHTRFIAMSAERRDN